MRRTAFSRAVPLPGLAGSSSDVVCVLRSSFEGAFSGTISDTEAPKFGKVHTNLRCHFWNMNSWLYNILVNSTVINNISKCIFKGAGKKRVQSNSFWRIVLDKSSLNLGLHFFGTQRAAGQVVPPLRSRQLPTNVWNGGWSSVSLVVWWQEVPKLSVYFKIRRRLLMENPFKYKGRQNLHLNWVLLRYLMQKHKITLSSLVTVAKTF